MRQLLPQRFRLTTALKVALLLATLLGISVSNAQPFTTTRIFQLPLGGTIAAVPLCKGSPLDAQTTFCRFGSRSQTGQTESFDAGINQADLPDWANRAEFNVVTLDGRLQAIRVRAAHQPEKILESLTARFGLPINQSSVNSINLTAQWKAEGVDVRMTCLAAYKVCELEFHSAEYDAYNRQLRIQQQTAYTARPATP